MQLDTEYRDVRWNFFEDEEADYYKKVRVNNFVITIILNIKVEVIKEHHQLKLYLSKIRPYLKDINSLKKSDNWKLQSTITVLFLLKIMMKIMVKSM